MLPITVVVPTKDRPDLLDQCLKTIAPQLDAGDELIVVDSASRDPGIGSIAERHGATYVRVDRRGASRARNAGWHAARHPVIAFVDDDVFVAPDWAASLRDAFQRRPRLGLLTGRVEAPPGGRSKYAASTVEEREEEEFGRWDARRKGITGNAACSKDALEAVGGLDEALGPGTPFRSADDKDLFDRIIAAGFEGVYDPAVLAYHDQWRSRSERLRLEWDYGIAAGAYLAKVARMDRRRTGGVAKDLLWRWGLKDLARCIRSGYKTGILAAAIRIVGMLIGLPRGAVVPVRDGHFRPRRVAP